VSSDITVCDLAVAVFPQMYEHKLGASDLQPVWLNSEHWLTVGCPRLT